MSMSDVAWLHRLWPAQRSQSTSDVECTQWSAALKVGCHYRQWPAHIGQPMSDGATTIVRGLHTSAFQRRTRPVRIVRGLHTSVSRRRTCPTRIICSMHTSLFQSLTWPARIVCGLHLLDERRLTRRKWSPSSRQHADVHAIQKSKDFEAPFKHINIFIYFPLSILNVFASRGSFVPYFITFTVRMILKHLLFVKNMYSIISFTCLEVFSIIFIFFNFYSFL